jgi:hypothetical protein
MNNIYVIKISFSSKYINNQLLPWKEHLDSEHVSIANENQSDNSSCSDINEYVQIGMAIKTKENDIYFISPFSVNIPYSNIGLSNIGDSEIKLKCSSVEKKLN